MKKHEHIDDVASEFVQLPLERILDIHILGDNSSGISVKGILGLEFYIDLIDLNYINKL